MDENQLAVKKVSNKIGIILFLILAVTYIVQIIFSVAVSMLFPNAVRQPWYMWLITVVSLYLTAFPIYLHLMKSIPDFDISCEKKYNVKEMIMLIFICMAAAYVFNIVSLLINALIGYLKGSAVINPIETAVFSSNVLYTLIVACIMAPVVEEIMFRKIMINKLVGYDERLAIIVSAFAFALFHGNLYQLLYAFVLGIIFAYITVKSGTIKYAIILHITVNTFGSVIFPYFLLNSNKIAAAIIVPVIFAYVIAGIVLFITKRRILFPVLKNVSENDGQEKIKLSTALMSKGIIVFWIASAILISVSTFVG